MSFWDSCFADHALFNAKGGVYVWGGNVNGQLGLNHKIPTFTPTCVTVKNSDVYFVYSGYEQSLLIMNDNEIYVCGETHIQHLTEKLFSNPSSNVYQYHQPVSLSFLKLNFTIDITISSISCGLFHTMFKTKSGLIYSCGRNTNGQLGHGDIVHRKNPTLVKFFKPNVVHQIVCGANYNLALTTNKHVYSWGLNEENQLGFTITDEFISTPQHITFFNSLESIKQIYCCQSSSFALTSKNKLFSWGSNDSTQCGHLCSSIITEPKQITFTSESILKVSCGYEHVLCLTTRGTLYGWGNNTFLQLANEILDSSLPMKIDLNSELFNKQRVINVVSRGDTCFACLEGGDVLGWGNNYDLSSGIPHLNPGSRKSKMKPVILEFFKDHQEKVIAGIFLLYLREVLIFCKKRIPWKTEIIVILSLFYSCDESRFLKENHPLSI